MTELAENQKNREKLAYFYKVIQENLLINVLSSSYKLIRASKGINAGLTEKEYSKDLIFERVSNDSI